MPFILSRPYIGILVWSWISYMSPHRLTWSFAYDLPFAHIVAIVLFVSILLNKEKKRIPINILTIIWLILIIWFAITTAFAIYQDIAFEQFTKVIKIQIIVWLTMMIITTKARINYLIWVIVISIGFYSTKGGLFTLLHGGGSRVYGPSGSFIEENNSLALATLMILPLMYYLIVLHKNNKFIYWGLISAILLSVFSILGSQSRGALISIVAVAIFFLDKNKK